MEHNLGKYWDALYDAVDPEEIEGIFGLRDDFLMLHYGNRKELYDKIVGDLLDSPNIEEGFERDYLPSGGNFFSARPRVNFNDGSGILVTVGGFQYPLHADELVEGNEHAIYTMLNTSYDGKVKGDLLTFAFKDVVLDFGQYIMNSHITTRIPTTGEGIWRKGVNHIPKIPSYV